MAAQNAEQAVVPKLAVCAGTGEGRAIQASEASLLGGVQPVLHGIHQRAQPVLHEAYARAEPTLNTALESAGPYLKGVQEKTVPLLQEVHARARPAIDAAYMCAEQSIVAFQERAKPVADQVSSNVSSAANSVRQRTEPLLLTARKHAKSVAYAAQPWFISPYEQSNEAAQASKDDFLHFLHKVGVHVPGLAKCLPPRVSHKTKPLINFYREYVVDEEPLGKGHFAKVFLARHKRSGLPVAAKIIDKSRMEPEDGVSLSNEIGIMRMLTHPHIVKLWCVFEDANYLVLCEELCQGGELFDRIVAKERYSEKLARAVCNVLLTTMAYYHDEGVVHLDLKPENLMLVDAQNKTDETGDMFIKVGDWGLARIIDKSRPLHDQCGTPGYTAPEVLAGVAINPIGYDTKADIWSLGVITYILLCGYPPYDLLPNASFVEEYVTVSTTPVTFQEDDWAPVSAVARDFVLRMLKVDPRKRWSASELLEHQWMTSKDVSDDHLMHAAKKFRRWNAARKLRSCVRTQIVINRLRKSFVLHWKDRDDQFLATRVDSRKANVR